MVIQMKCMPVVGETVLGTEMTYVPGGKGANQACAAVKLGGNVKMLGCVGQDEFGEILIKNLTDCGADVLDLKKFQNAEREPPAYMSTNKEETVLLLCREQIGNVIFPICRDMTESYRNVIILFCRWRYPRKQFTM